MSTAEQSLFDAHINDPEVIVWLQTDVTPEGRFASELIIVTSSRLKVFRRSRETELLRLDVALRDVKNVRDVQIAGGAMLHAEIDGTPTDIARGRSAEAPDIRRLADHLRAGQTDTYVSSPTMRSQSDRCPKCNLPFVVGSKACVQCASRVMALRRIIRYLRPYRGLVAMFAILAVLSNALAVVTPYLTKPLMDIALVPSTPDQSLTQRTHVLIAIVAGMLVAQVLGTALSVIQGRTIVRLSHRLAHELRLQLFEHLQELPLNFFNDRQAGNLQTRLSQDTQDMESFLVVVAHFIGSSLLLLATGSVLLCALNWRLFLLVLIPVPLIAVLWRWVLGMTERRWPRWWHRRGLMNAVLSESLAGIRVIRAFAQESQEVRRFTMHSELVLERGRDAEGTSMTLYPILNFVTGITSLIVWYVGGIMVLSQTITPGTLVMFVACLAIFLGPLEFVNRSAEWVGRGLGSAGRLFEVLDSKPTVLDPASPVELVDVRGELALKDVTFSYESGKPVLHDVTLTIEPGEMIGLVGHSGSGKTTIVNLLCRFYDPDSGDVSIDGVSLRNVRQRDFRQHIGVVMQETFLFNGTVAENIRYGTPNASLMDVIAAAKTANAHDFIARRPDGYDTVVGDRGQALSGGERQRIAIARAVLRNPRILIFDEATSALDADTEQQIQEAMTRLVRGRTTIVIAHRLSTLHQANRLVVLKHGRIVEVGRHDELVARKGELWRLLDAQEKRSESVVAELKNA